VTRYRQHVHDGRSTEDAVALALGSAGKASMFAGVTVCIALLGLLFVPIPLVQTLGVAAAIGVAVMMVAACTLLPALLGFAGHRRSTRSGCRGRSARKKAIRTRSSGAGSRATSPRVRGSRSSRA
jgi:RND superfamily putative drug exporter